MYEATDNPRNNITKTIPYLITSYFCSHTIRYFPTYVSLVQKIFQNALTFASRACMLHEY